LTLLARALMITRPMPLLDTEHKTQVLDYIKTKVGPEQFNNWFKLVSLEEPEEGTLEIKLPNIYYKTWFEKNYREIILAALKESRNRDYTISFTIPPAGKQGKTGSETNATIQPSLFEPDTPAKQTPQTTPVTISKRRSLLTLNPKYTFDYFVVGPCNRFAHAAALAVAENPAKAYNPLFIYGSVGLGKTHLLQAICHVLVKRAPELKLVYLSCEGFVNDYITTVKSGSYDAFRNKYRSADVLMIDDIHFLGLGEKVASQEEFFHTFNALHNAQKQIILSSDSPPKDIPTLEDRLISRFKWGLVAPLDPPSFETRVAILRNKAELNKMLLPDDVINFIATNIDSNIRELEGAVIKLIGLARLTNQAVDIVLAREALKDLIGSSPLRFTINDIQELVSRFFNVSIPDLQSKKRAKSVSLYRQVGIYLIRTLTGHSLEEIGLAFGGKDHTTIMYSVEKIKKRIQKDKQFKETINRLVDELKKKRE
jgi:chromosomal replication initiator protein